MQKKYLVTPALPYANGPIHLGHLVEHIQVNVFVRALRMAGEDVLCVCGADSHGTPIEMSALKKGIPPDEMASFWQECQDQSLRGFGIEFDGGYGSTHTKENEIHAQKIFSALKSKGYVKQREIEQLFDPELKRFLPDRMVRGTCPQCQAKDQYGDSCEACGRTYHPTDLKDPRSALSGAVPVIKKSTHYFVTLNKFQKLLLEWENKPGTVQDDTKSFLKNWFEEGLRDWDISRDGPYFGFLIPGESNKYFYVWLDAPVGYISMSEKAAKERGRTFSDYWQDPSTKIIHFIGKDIVYFHTLFWPAMLMAAEYTLPSQVVVHGMLTVDGEKMSKSRGTFILADTFMKHADPEALRYYFACKLSHKSEDIDLNLTDFMQRVNTDLVNKVVNLVSRTIPLFHRFFDGKVGHLDPSAKELTDKGTNCVESVKNLYLTHETNRALNEIIRLAEDANRYLQENAPWNLVKSDKERAQLVLSTGLHIGKICLGLLKPVLPRAVELLEDMLNEKVSFTFANVAKPVVSGTQLKPYSHVFKRIEEKGIKAMIQESKSDNTHKVQQLETKKAGKVIDFKHFMDVDLRAAKILEAKAVEGSDKLIACRLDVGSLGQRQVFAGLRPHVEPSELQGQTVVVVANLAPRKMRFGVSEGMILACGEEKPIPLILKGVNPGDRVR